MIIGGMSTFTFDIPTELIIKYSEFLINKINVSKAAKNATIGIIYSTKLKKFKIASWIIISIGTFLPVDFRNCSTKSPIMSNAAKNKGVPEVDILEWQNQLKQAEKDGRFAFTAYSILTSAYNLWNYFLNIIDHNH